MSKRNGLRLDFYDFQSLFSRISHGFCCTAVRAVFIIYCNQDVALIYHVYIPLAESGYPGFLRADDMDKICFRLNILTAGFVSVMVGKGPAISRNISGLLAFLCKTISAAHVSTPIALPQIKWITPLASTWSIAQSNRSINTWYSEDSGSELHGKYRCPVKQHFIEIFPFSINKFQKYCGLNSFL